MSCADPALARYDASYASAMGAEGGESVEGAGATSTSTRSQEAHVRAAHALQIVARLEGEAVAAKADRFLSNGQLEQGRASSSSPPRGTTPGNAELKERLATSCTKR